MEVKIISQPSEADGVFGELSIEGSLFCKTLERPDYNFDGIIGNEKGRSCIPRGTTYVCKRTLANIVKSCYSNWNSNIVSDEIIAQLKRGETFEVTNITCGETANCNRTRVLIHTANIIEDLEGCIGLGDNFGVITKGNVTRRGIINSKNTFALFMQEMNGIEEFNLVIEEA